MTRKLSATYHTATIPERHGEHSVYSHHSCVVMPVALDWKDLDLGLKLRARVLTNGSRYNKPDEGKLQLDEDMHDELIL